MNTKIFILMLLCFILILLYSTATLFSQSRADKLNHFGNNEIFFTNTITLPSSSNDSLQVIFCYSFLYDGLVFQKNAANVFFATPEIEAVFKDKEGITRKRFISNDTIYANSYEQTQSKNMYYTNYVMFYLVKNDYKIISNFNNSKAIRTFPIESNINISDININPFFLQADVIDNAFTPFLLSNCVPFSASDFVFFVPIIYHSNTKINEEIFDYKIQKKNDNSIYD